MNDDVSHDQSMMNKNMMSNFGCLTRHLPIEIGIFAFFNRSWTYYYRFPLMKVYLKRSWFALFFNHTRASTSTILSKFILFVHLSHHINNCRILLKLKIYPIKLLCKFSMYRLIFINTVTSSTSVVLTQIFPFIVLFVGY